MNTTTNNENQKEKEFLVTYSFKRKGKGYITKQITSIIAKNKTDAKLLALKMLRDEEAICLKYQKNKCPLSKIEVIGHFNTRNTSDDVLVIE